MNFLKKIIKNFKRTSQTYDTCAICLEEMDKKRFCRKTKCNHNYHRICLYTWLKENNNCPLCRTILRNHDSYDMFTHLMCMITPLFLSINMKIYEGILGKTKYHTVERLYRRLVRKEYKLRKMDVYITDIQMYPIIKLFEKLIEKLNDLILEIIENLDEVSSHPSQGNKRLYIELLKKLTKVMDKISNIS